MEVHRSKKNNKIGFWAATSLVVGNMIGSGIFLLPATLAMYGGISLLGWLFTTIGVIFLALAFSRLSRIIKSPGGPYTYSKEGFGSFVGFLVAWGYWVSIWCGNAAIAVAGTGYLSALIPGLKNNKPASAIISIAVIWLFTFINTRKIKSIAFVQVVTTVLKVIPILIFGTIGFLYFNIDHFKPFNLSGLSTVKAITATAALTLWAFLGLESATIPSDKMDKPERLIPRATIAGTIFAAIIFIASTSAVMGIIEPSKLELSSAPFADAAKLIWGDWASYLMAASAVIACFGALNGWILLQGQIPRAAAKDKLFPEIFSSLSTNGTPIAGLIISSILATLLVSINYTRGLISMFEFILMLAILTVLLPYVFTSLSEAMLYLKKKRKHNTSQLTKSLLIGIPAFLYSLWAVVGLGIEIVLWGSALLASGIPVYLYMLKKNKKK